MNLTHSEAKSDVDAFLAEIAEVDDLAFSLDGPWQKSELLFEPEPLPFGEISS